MYKETEYDAVIVGAGPAGSTTARAAAEAGLNVLLIDRKLEVGVPNKCGEFIPSLEEMRRLAPEAENLEKFFDPPSNCIVNKTRHIKFVFPNMKEIEVPFRGVVVERKLYDKHLANEAARSGADISPHTRCLALLEGGRRLRVRDIDSEFEIQAKAIVGADGANSLIARSAGLPVSRDPLDYGVGYQYEMVNVEHDSDYVDMYFGREYAPGTYAWIIPKGDDVANVGTGARTPFMTGGLNIRDYQRNFLKKHPVASKKLRKAVPTAIKAGYVPAGGPMAETCTGNVIVVGDAAGQTIPTVGGGIPTALICGNIAGEKLAEHINEGKTLALYDVEWRRQIGKTLDNSLRFRKISDVMLRSESIIDLAAERGWLNEEMIENLILCRIDAKVKLLEKTLMKLLKGLNALNPSP